MNNICIDFSKTAGKIKPMHGVGQPPIRGVDCSMFAYLKKAKIPFARLHDVGGWFGGNMFVDIPNLFRDFSADPSDPANYDFTFTDLLITALMENGVEPFFRLGVTIENFSKIKAYRIYPPADYHKWAQICEGVIRHYTEGWADGFHYDIRYWEIWNEPDNYEEVEENQLWRGTKEQYYQFYEVASKYLKAKFPHLKIGGYGSCGFLAFSEEIAPYAASSPRFQYFVEFFEGFMAHIQKTGCPLDFFTWHSYAGIDGNQESAAFARRRLDECGYSHTEHFLNEWNWYPELFGTPRHAALTGAMILAMQDTSLDGAMFYDARCDVGMFSGMFNGITTEPYPAYYSFYAFGKLYEMGIQVPVQGKLPEGVYACAAKGEAGCIMVSNINTDPVKLPLEVTGVGEITECKIVKDGATWEDCCYDGELPAESVLYIKFKL